MKRIEQQHTFFSIELKKERKKEGKIDIFTKYSLI